MNKTSNNKRQGNSQMSFGLEFKLHHEASNAKMTPFDRAILGVWYPADSQGP